MSRIPSHEIEALVETTLRKNITKLIGENENTVTTHILNHHQTIPAVELVRTCIEKITIGLNIVTLYVKSESFEKLVQGVIWRDEHFDGLDLKEIAHREGCSEAYVGTANFSSFEILQSALSRILKIPCYFPC